MKLQSLIVLFSTLAAAECIVVPGNEVVVRDLAGRFSELAAQPQAQVMMLAPGVGVKRWVTPLESRRLWGKLGLSEAPLEGFCVERKSHLLTASILMPALRRSLPDANIQINLVEFSRFPVPEGELEFPLSGLLASARTRPDEMVLWRGRVIGKGSGSVAVWVRVRLSVERQFIVAKHELAMGQKVTPGDVETVRGMSHPLEAATDASVSFVGQIARQRIRAGQKLVPSLFAPPQDVIAGQPVKVDVIYGQVRLRLEAIAEGKGRSGDSIWLMQASGGKRFKARVSGPAEAVLEIAQDDSTTLSGGRTRVAGDVRRGGLAKEGASATITNRPVH